MASWAEFESASPELAAAIRARFEATGLGFLATLRTDGSPRISGIEPSIAEGELWLGMMPDSLKARDLLRDPRMALHSASIDKQVVEGDAKISGRAIEVTNEAEIGVYLRAVHGVDSVDDFPGDGIVLLRVDLLDASFLRPERSTGSEEPDHLAIDIWTAAAGTRRVDRY